MQNGHENHRGIIPEIAGSFDIFLLAYHLALPCSWLFQWHKIVPWELV